MHTIICSDLKKMSMIFLDRLSGFLVILFFLGLLTYTYFSLSFVALVLLLLLIFWTRNKFISQSSLKKGIAILLFSTLGYFLYVYQINIIIDNFIPEIDFYKSALIGGLLVFSAILPVSILGIGAREIVFQLLLVQIGLGETFAMKLAIMFVLSNLAVNLLYAVLWKLLKKDIG